MKSSSAYPMTWNRTVTPRENLESVFRSSSSPAAIRSASALSRVDPVNSGPRIHRPGQRASWGRSVDANTSRNVASWPTAAGEARPRSSPGEARWPWKRSSGPLIATIGLRNISVSSASAQQALASRPGSASLPPIGPVKSVALLVRFRQLEIGRGIVPFGGATFRVPAQLGWGNAMRFLLTAEEFGAAEALRIGLVQEVVPAGSHIERARELARLIARQAPLGVQGTLANARTGTGPGPDAARDHLASLLPEILHSEDAAEGLRSFAERREARF